jgi:hypothetical protein
MYSVASPPLLVWVTPNMINTTMLCALSAGSCKGSKCDLHQHTIVRHFVKVVRREQQAGESDLQLGLEAGSGHHIHRCGTMELGR